MPLTMDILLAVWLFMLGACIGSFLNVVILRVPAGESIVHGSSHCPKCGHAIRWYDNVPIFGWLVLRGRCRDCGLPISIRYPIVEFVVATLFLIIGWFEPLARGTYLSTLSASTMTGQLAASAEFEMWLLYAYHMVLVTTLIAATVIALDGQRLPIGVVIPAAIVGLAAPILWPALQPMFEVPPIGPDMPRVQAAIGILLGVPTGGVLGLGTAWSMPRAKSANDSLAALWIGALCGLFLGWFGALVIVTAASALMLMIRALAWAFAFDTRMPWSGYVVATTVVLILARQSLEHQVAGGDSRALWATGMAILMLWVLISLAGRVGVRH